MSKIEREYQSVIVDVIRPIIKDTQFGVIAKGSELLVQTNSKYKYTTGYATGRHLGLINIASIMIEGDALNMNVNDCYHPEYIYKWNTHATISLANPKVFEILEDYIRRAMVACEKYQRRPDVKKCC